MHLSATVYATAKPRLLVHCPTPTLAHLFHQCLLNALLAIFTAVAEEWGHEAG